jgi:hypothetical protein
MTGVPQELAVPARERVTGEVPGDVAERLRVWAALRRKPAAHVVAELVCQGVPTAERLRALVGQKGTGNGQADH